MLIGFLAPLLARYFQPVKLLGYLKKVPLWFWLILIMGGGYWYFTNELKDAKAEIALTLLAGDSTVQLLDGQWSARLAQSKLESEAAKELADELQAKLIASATVEITPDKIERDSVEVITEVLTDSTRVGTVLDSLDFVIVDIKAVAPLCCENIRINYSLTFKPIEFEVALLRTTDDRAVFAISYFGGTTEINAPYARLPAKVDRFKPFVGGSYDFINSGWNLVGGAELETILGVKLSAYLRQSISSMVENPTRFLIDVRKYF